MAAAQILSSIEAQRRFAGNTRAANNAAPPPPVATPAEILNTTSIRSELDHMTSGGFHPEALYYPIARTLEAGIGTPGPNGGTVPARNHPTSPGPAGAAVGARGRQLWADLRARFGG